MVHLALLVRELAGTETGSGIHHHRRLNLQIAGLGVAVEEEIDEGSLKSRALALVNRESCAGDLHTEVEVDDVQLLGKLPVRECVRSQIRYLIAHLDHEIVFRALALRNEIARDIRKQDYERVEFRLVVGGLLLQFG